MAAAVLLGAAAFAQLRITSFNSGGQLTFTNFARVGAYRVESRDSVTGLWKPFADLTNLNLILANTNRVTAQVPLSNSPMFYRVAWIPPDPIGVWDYHGYDAQGTLVITGHLNISSTTVLSTNPANPVYGIHGSWNLQYAGPATNQLGWLGPQIGTGSLGGSLNVGYADMYIWWPTNIIDYNIQLSGTLWPNTYTGTWIYYPGQAGPFSAVRWRSTNLINNNP